MERFIEYFYGIITDCIKKDGEYYIFKSDGKNYLLVKNAEFDDELKLMEKAEYTKSNPKYHKILCNRYGKIISNINGKEFIVMQTSIEKNRIISISDIDLLRFDTMENSKTYSYFKWDKLWESKIDALEKWIQDKEEMFRDCYAIFNYYIGLSENALLYLKNVILKATPTISFLQHYRLTIETTLFDYYNPISVLFDHQCRDIGEYIKSTIINKNFSLNDFASYMVTNNLSKQDIEFLYARIMFPSFIYDYLENCLSSNERINGRYLNTVVEYYEEKLKEISKFLNEKYNIVTMEWLKKR